MSEPAAPDHRLPWGTVILAGSLTALAPLAIDMYLPSLPSIESGLHASASAGQATLGAFLIGLAIGQFVYGPTSDRIGRRLPLLFGLALFLVATVACALAPSIELMIVARFFQALGGCAGQVLARASIRDKYDHQASARILSSLMLVMGVAPILAPLAGGWLLAFGWRSIFIAQLVVGGAIAVAAIFAFDETHPPEKAAHARGEPVWRTFGALLKNPQLIGFILAGAFNGGAIFAYISSAPTLLIETYKISPANFGWVFGLNAVGMVALSQLNVRLLRWRTPEDILMKARPASIVAAAGLVVCAYTGWGGMWGVLGFLFLTISSFGLVGSNTQAAAMNVDLARTGAISSLLGASSFGVGAAMSVVSGALHDGTARPIAWTIMALILLSSAALYGLARPPKVAAAGA